MKMIHPGFVASEVRVRAFNPDGKSLETSPVGEVEVMTVETCARLILQAMIHRKRELVITLRGKIGQWIKFIARQAIKAGKQENK